MALLQKTPVARPFRWFAVFGLVVALAGCAQVGGLWDGITGKPIEQVDSPSWYHVGKLLIPFLSDLFALIRRFFFMG